ncbi:diacylglycerol kinase catalytic region [Haliangium ochraceum DSM 14365]|uniref:Diacylglycerol kinase catalytic region n=1 Tax=Haliangium ochraceum (strain DSM 14365 / JCM 11303 / SMP-2) TaxID=502025 RepID=D0LHU1_HALO1|nr:diacylglycerol kinase catalytic region [Haliangium ochraceum DSM 14365]
MIAEPLPVPQRRALFLRNPNARNGDEQAEKARACLEAHRVELVEEVAADPEGFRLAVEQRASEVDVVIVGGGDGTINAAAPAIVGSGVPMAILPLGTANDLARSLTIASDLDEACRVIATGHPRDIDLGMVNGHYFFNAAGVGLSGEVTRSLDREQKRRWGVLSYASVLTEAWRQSEVFGACLRHDGKETRIRSLQITVGNSRFYGGGMTIADDATVDDGLLHLYSIEPMSLIQLIGVAPFLRLGRQRNSEGILTLNTSEVELITDRPLPVNADGEIVGRTPARFSLIPKALQVLVPEDYEQRRAEMLGGAG